MIELCIVAIGIEDGMSFENVVVWFVSFRLVLYLDVIWYQLFIAEYNILITER